jgi:hypothetical protein
VVVIESDTLSDAERMKVLSRFAIAALQLGLGSFALLAERGLLHPEEAEGLLSGVEETFNRLPPKMRDSLPPEITEGFADIRRRAAETWNANG